MLAPLTAACPSSSLLPFCGALCRLRLQMWLAAAGAWLPAAAPARAAAEFAAPRVGVLLPARWGLLGLPALPDGGQPALSLLPSVPRLPWRWSQCTVHHAHSISPSGLRQPCCPAIHVSRRPRHAVQLLRTARVTHEHTCQLPHACHPCCLCFYVPRRAVATPEELESFSLQSSHPLHKTSKVSSHPLHKTSKVREEAAARLVPAPL